jgi:hypothetical protein
MVSTRVPMASHPDAELHPVAAGAANALVERHRAKQPLKLMLAGFVRTFASLSFSC